MEYKQSEKLVSAIPLFNSNLIEKREHDFLLPQIIVFQDSTNKRLNK